MLGFPVVVPQRVLFAPALAERGDAFQVADNARAVVYVVRTAGGAGVQGAFVYVVALVADGDSDVGAEIVAACFGGDVQKGAEA